jgi:ketosteroid isomerase-like protein
MIRRKSVKKSVIMSLGAAALIVVLAGGCQIGGPSDEKLINTTVSDWKAAHTAKDLDGLMATLSENYVSMDGGGKDSMREFISRAFEEGFMDNVEIKIEDAQTTIEGDKATFGPVKFVGDRGTFAFKHILQKEDGKWLIVGVEMQEQEY